MHGNHVAVMLSVCLHRSTHLSSPAQGCAGLLLHRLALDQQTRPRPGSLLKAHSFHSTPAAIQPCCHKQVQMAHQVGPRGCWEGQAKMVPALGIILQHLLVLPRAVLEACRHAGPGPALGAGELVGVDDLLAHQVAPLVLQVHLSSRTAAESGARLCG